MRLHLRKRYLLLGIIILLIVVGGAIFYLQATLRKIPQCAKAKTYFGTPSCGYVSSATDKTSSIVSGFIESKKQLQDKSYELEFLTKNERGVVVMRKISFPTLPRHVAVTLVPLDKGDQPQSKFVDPREAFNMLKKGDEVALVVVTPTNQELSQSIQKLGKSKFTDCIIYNQSFLKTLAPSKFKNISNTNSKDCPVSISQIIQYQ